jgi:hypothetical protein
MPCPSYLCLGISCSPPWADWVTQFAHRRQTTIAGLFGAAVEHLARAEGYPKKPPLRLTRTRRRKPTPAAVRVAATR